MTFDMRLCEVRDETREETWEEAWDVVSHEKARETARNLIAMGLPLEQIAQATGLTLEEVASLGVTANTHTDQRTLQQIVEERVEESKMLWLANGEERGEKQGFDRGIRETRIETARNLIAMGLPLEQIARAVGLSIEEVKALL